MKITIWFDFKSYCFRVSLFRYGSRPTKLQWLLKLLAIQLGNCYFKAQTHPYAHTKLVSKTCFVVAKGTDSSHIIKLKCSSYLIWKKTSGFESIGGGIRMIRQLFGSNCTSAKAHRKSNFLTRSGTLLSKALLVEKITFSALCEMSLKFWAQKN